MPLPLVAIAVALLIRAAIAAITFIARRVATAVAVDLAWAYLQPRLMDWVETYMPDIVVAVIRYSIGLNIELPLTPASLTHAINEKVGEQIFTDITDAEAVKMDCAKLALLKLNQALPGLTLTVKDFIGTPAAKRRLLYKMRIFMQTQSKMALESGSSEIFTADIVVATMAELQSGYAYTPHVNIEDVPHAVGREMARWYARNLTRTWVSK